MSDNQELIVIENLDPAKLFRGDGLDELLESVSKQVVVVVPDISTALGRKDLASLAHKVAKSRTALDLLGKNHVAAAKKELKLFDSNRKKAREYLEDLQAKTRQPLTEWEAAEAKRSQDIVDRVQAIKDMVPTEAYVIENTRIEVFDERLKDLQEMTIGEDFEELIDIATTTRDESIAALAGIVGRLETQAKDKAELERLRKESEAQAQKDREAEVARNATANAEAAAAVERQKEYTARVAAEKRAVEAEANAKRKAEQAAKAERDRIEAEQQAQQAAIRKREANTRHKGKIHSDIVAKLYSLKLVSHEDDAKAIVKAIARDLIPHIKINY